ncbi:MAG: helix-turn-helix domain-containing protein [Rhodospirillaceae bacterium]|nr:helix-turn-helix domain-containing protein [Rhodospirillaceae bacterium]
MKSITAVRPGDCFERWHDVTCHDYSVTACRAVTGPRFRGTISHKAFGALAISAISTDTASEDEIRVARNPAEIRRDPRDHFMVWLMLGGRMSLAQEGRAACMHAGDMFVYDQSRPFVLEFGRRVRALTLTIPRPLLTARLPQARNLAGRRIDGGSSLGAFAGTILRQLYRVEEAPDEVAARLGDSALDMLATTLAAELGLPAAGERDGLGAVKRYILDHLHDPALDLARIVESQHIAARTLYRLFAREGTTPMRWLWQQRLAASYKALAEGRDAKVTDVALRYGFNDSSHFSRAFKSAFGHSPREVKRAAP